MRKCKKLLVPLSYLDVYKRQFTMLREDREEFIAPVGESAYTEDDKWNQKIEEFYSFFRTTSMSEITTERKRQSIDKYKIYGRIFLNLQSKKFRFVNYSFMPLLTLTTNNTP